MLLTSGYASAAARARETGRLLPVRADLVAKTVPPVLTSYKLTIRDLKRALSLAVICM
jgi:hypothetical protein